MTEPSLSHTRRDCTSHIVWITKYRRKILYGECRTEIKYISRSFAGEEKDRNSRRINQQGSHTLEFTNSAKRICSRRGELSERKKCVDAV